MLVIIDTLQMIRSAGYDNTYANDYRDLSALKQIADAHGIAILLIHHLRKESADDVFNRISGTTAISGAVDSSFTLVEERRGSGRAKLSCIGRDIEYRELTLERNGENVWELVSDSRTQPELLGDRIIYLLSELMRERTKFIGTPTELSERIDPVGVERIRKHKRRRANMAEQNIFSGLVYCLDCGGTMVLHRAHTMDAVKNNFMCSTYKKKGKEVCSGHYIREQELSAILLDDIRRVTHFARQNELRFAEHIRKKQGKEAQQEIAVLRKKIDTMQKRQAELTKLFKRLYEDSVLGRIPDEQYRILSQEYTTEQKEIQEQLPAMEVRLQELKDSSTNIARFIENAKRYKEIPELTAEILRIFIKRVEVGERAEKYSRTAPQEVRIYYRDIGLVDELPQSMTDSMAEEIPNEVA